MAAGVANSPSTSAACSSTASPCELRRSIRRTLLRADRSVTVCSAVAGLDMSSPVECRSYLLSWKCGKSYGAGQREATDAQFALPTRQLARSSQHRLIEILVTEPPPIRSALAAGNLGLYDVCNFFMTTGRDAVLCSVIPQALWYFEDEPIAIARAGLPIAGSARDASATDDVAAWAARHAIGMPLEY